MFYFLQASKANSSQVYIGWVVDLEILEEWCLHRIFFEKPFYDSNGNNGNNK